MAAHRYWRLFIAANNAATQAAIGELILATTPGGASVTTGGTASASSNGGAGVVADKAFNGTLSSSDYWQSASSTYNTLNGDSFRQGSEWLQYDLGAGNAKDIAEVRIYFPAAGSISIAMSPAQFALMYSDDGKTWKLQRSWCLQVFAAGETKTFDATPLPDASITNRLLFDKRYRFNSAAQLQSAINFNAKRFRGLFNGSNFLTPVRNTPYTGRKRIVGSTTVLGLPAARMVHLFDQKRGQIIATAFTKADGQFQFTELAPGTYTVMGVDPSGTQNSVVYAHVVAVD